MLEAMDGQCKIEHRFDEDKHFIPYMTMRAGCEEILADWGEDLEAFMMARDNNDLRTLTKQFCGDVSKTDSITRACYNLNILEHGLPKNESAWIKWPYFYAEEAFEK